MCELMNKLIIYNLGAGQQERRVLPTVQRRVGVERVVLQRQRGAAHVQPARQHQVQADHIAYVLLQGERLGLFPLHGLERCSRPREGIYQGQSIRYTLSDIKAKSQ